MLVLNRHDIAGLLDIPALMPAMAQALRAVARGEAVLPLRSMVAWPGENRMGLMAGWLGAPAGHGVKVLSLFPGNPARGLSSHTGLVLLFDPEDGLPLAVMDAAELTALRTAAATAVATDALASPGASRLAVIGCGEQAGVHIAAMRAVRSLSSIRVWGRDAGKAAAFAEAQGVEVAGSIEGALEGADIVVTATPARAPLISAAMLRAGMHVNAVGASVPSMQEFAADVVPAVRFFTDYIPSMEAQAAEMIAARAQGLVGESFEVTELGAVLEGRAAGRQEAGEITYYRSLGIAAQDLAAAHVILARAKAAGLGVSVDMR
jgi:ornithine cyclodeaminase